MFDGNNLPHELLLTTKETCQLIKHISNFSTDIKLSTTQISKIIQSGEFLASLLSKLAGALIIVAVLMNKKYFSSIRNNNGYFSN